MEWLEKLPAMALARSVPCVHPEGRCVVLEDPLGCTSVLVAFVDAEPYRYTTKPVRELRVDLDDPQGFAYALRWVAMCGGWGEVERGFALLAPDCTGHSDGGRHAELCAVARVEATDADRLALAKACAEVAR